MNRLRRFTRFRAIRVAFMLGVSGLGLLAQNVSVFRSNSYEVGGFAGASYGVDQFRTMGGANITYAVNKYILPYAEFSYFPGIDRQDKRSNSNTLTSFPLYDFHGGVHLRLPVFRESPIVPYAVFGLGVLHATEAPYVTQFSDGTSRQGTYPAFSQFAINGGGGVRYYLSQRFGVRVEAKVYKGTGQLSEAFGKIEAGFFFQIH